MGDMSATYGRHVPFPAITPVLLQDERDDGVEHLGEPKVLGGEHRRDPTLLLPFAAAAGRHVPSSAPDIAGILWLGVVVTVIGYGLFFAGLRSLAGSVAMILVLAAALLGERLMPATVLGGGLLLGAVVVLYLAPPHASSSSC